MANGCSARNSRSASNNHGCLVLRDPQFARAAADSAADTRAVDELSRKRNPSNFSPEGNQ